MKSIFAAAAMAAILSACGNDSANDEAREQAAVAEALEEQQAQVAQSMQERWNARSQSGNAAEGDIDEGRSSERMTGRLATSRNTLRSATLE
jgi:Flp pilus assembly protein TadB